MWWALKPFYVMYAYANECKNNLIWESEKKLFIWPLNLPHFILYTQLSHKLTILFNKRQFRGKGFLHAGRDSGNYFCCFSFLGYPKRNDFVPSRTQKNATRNDARLVSDLKNTRPGTTRNHQERPETNQLMVESWGRGWGLDGGEDIYKQETTIIRPYFGYPKVVSTISARRGINLIIILLYPSS